ncbi:MAG: hypothetical protein DRH26_00575 [Deltaproteobacteria bacterium]|nr:MAG: hypothetical protein DRH26_00575 [Deltaproteobacteria bacterium]
MKKPLNAVLTKDQECANNEFLDFLVSDDNFFIIQGAAGTGKSFLIRHLLETFYAKYSAYCLLLQKEVQTFNIKITATTNKAVNVVDDFLEDFLAKKSYLSVSTIYSLLGLKVTNDINTGKTTLSFNNKRSFRSEFTHGANEIPLVFIDEASFISEELQEIIQAVLVNDAKAKVVFIGDKYQLAPVGQNFSALDMLKCNKVSLNKIIRNSGDIVKIGTQFRDTVETGIFTPISYNNSNVIHVDGKNFQQMIEQSFSDPNWNTSKSKVLAWTNERVQEYNQHIRQSLNKPEIFTTGEIVITNSFINGATHFSRSVDSEVMITKINPVTQNNYGIRGFMVELDGSHVGFMPEDFRDAKKWMKRLAAQKEWSKFFEIKENWLDLRAVYASSIHKSQGSTYDTVFLDLSDIGTNWNATDVARLMYVGITRAAKQVVCYGHLPDRYC